MNVKFLSIAVFFWGIIGTASIISQHYIRESATQPEPALNASRPNILFILADDLSWNSMGYMDYDLAFATPTLTALALRGVIMTNYYAQELCTPSRAALLTGRYPVSLGMQYGEILPNHQWALGADETLLSQVLRDSGYATSAVGKWNLGHYAPDFLPTARGFDSFLGFLGAESYYWSKYITKEKGGAVSQVRDFMQANATCYAPYNETDAQVY
ncbi:alkaline-phosphatase-like protein, partial [Ochromonadaceae sp. CCMP2298]